MTEIHPSITASEARFLFSEVIRLARALAAVRLESANRLAAIRAALGAAADGEADPLAYLRDQLAEETETQIPGRSGSGR
jgi:CelD/BcsL family acetyltransferase involved in cellulose biosynthesis